MLVPSIEFQYLDMTIRVFVVGDNQIITLGGVIVKKPRTDIQEQIDKRMKQNEIL